MTPLYETPSGYALLSSLFPRVAANAATLGYPTTSPSGYPRCRNPLRGKAAKVRTRRKRLLRFPPVDLCATTRANSPRCAAFNLSTVPSRYFRRRQPPLLHPFFQVRAFRRRHTNNALGLPAGIFIRSHQSVGCVKRTSTGCGAFHAPYKNLFVVMVQRQLSLSTIHSRLSPTQ